MANDVEINVRVSNQTGTGLAGVNASMNRLRQNASSASRSVTELRTALAGSMDASLDSSEVIATAQAMRSLRNDTSRAGTAMGTLTPRAVAAAAALELVRAAAQDASNALRTLRGRTAATSVAMQDLRTTSSAASSSLRTLSTRANSADGRMETLSTRAHALSTNMDGLDGSLRRVGGSMAGLRGGLGGLGSSLGNAGSGSRRLLMAAIALGPALVPIAAAVAPLVPALGAAGAAMGVFAAALIPQILNIGKLGEAQKAHKKAVEDSGRTSKEAAEAEKAWLKEIAKASPEVRKAAGSLGVMKDQYKDWTNSLAGDTLPVATKSFAILGALFPKLTPLVKASSAEFGRLANILAVGVQSKGFDEFMVKLADFSQRTLRAAIDGMVSFGQAMNRGIQSDGFREFLAYVRESGPIVTQTLGELMRALMKIVVAAADTGVGILTIVNALAQLVNAVPTELLSVLVQMAFAMKALQMVSMGLGPALAAAATGASGFIRAARFGGVSTAIAGVTASLTALQRASIVLAVLTAVVVGINALADKAKGAPPDVDRLTTSLKNLSKAGQFTGELKKTFGDMDGFVQKVQQMHASTESFDRLKSFTSLMPMGPIIDKITPKIDQLVNGTKSLGAMKDDFKAFDDSFANLAKGGHADEAAAQFQRFEGALKAAGMSAAQVSELFPQYQAAVSALAADQEMAARSMGLFGEQAIAVQAKLDAQKASTDGLRQAIQALNDANRQALGGMIGFEAAIDAAAKGAAENAGALNMVNGALDLNGEKARAAASLLADLANKTDEAAAAARDNGSSWEAVSGIYERGRAQLIASADAMGLTKDEAKALADQILSTPDKTAYLRGDIDDLQAKLKDAYARLAAAPSSKQVDIRAEISDLLAKMRQAQGAVNSLDSRTIFINTVYRTFREQHPGGQAMAHGGVIGAAGGGPRSRMTLVGEQGPELVDLAPGSRVRSNPDSKRIADGMAGGGGGGPMVLELRSSGSRIDDLLLEILRGAIRVKGGDVQVVLGSRNR